VSFQVHNSKCKNIKMADSEAMTGWLHKKLQGNTNKWKKCWYVLDTTIPENANLSHFVHATMARPDRGADRLATTDREMIELKDITKVVHQKKGMKFVLLSKTSGNIHLKAASEDAARKWVKAINRALKGVNEPKSSVKNSGEIMKSKEAFVGAAAKDIRKKRKKRVKKKSVGANSQMSIAVSEALSERSNFEEIDLNLFPPPEIDLSLFPPPASDPPPENDPAPTPTPTPAELRARRQEAQKAKKFGTATVPKGRMTFKQRMKAGSANVSRRENSVGPRNAVMPIKKMTAILPNVLEIPKFKKKTDKTRDLLLDTLLHSTSLNLVLFSDLNEAAIGKLVDKMYRVDVEAKEDIIQQGVQGNQFYVIESGRFHVYLIPSNDSVVDRQVRGFPQLVAQKGKGAFFGELALLYEQPSIVTVRAATDGILWAVTRQDFHEITMEVAKEQTAEKKKLLKGNEILGNFLSEKEMSAIADAMEYKTYKQGEVILSPGEQLKTLLFLKDGQIEVFDEEDNKLSEMRIGESFGEIGLLEEYEVEYKFVAGKDDTKCVVLDIAETEGVVGSLKEMVQEKWAQNPTLAQRVSKKTNTKMNPVKATVSHLRSSVANRFTIDNGVPSVNGSLIGSVNGSMIGSLIGSANGSFAQKGTEYSVELGTAISTVSVNSEMSAIDREWEESPPLIAKVDFKYLKPIKLLGRGNFGSVHLVINNHPQPLMISDADNERAPDYFALKVLSRDFITDNGWEEMADNEKQAMAELSYYTRSPFIVKLYHSFADRKNIYLLLELCDGGDLYQVMRTQPGHRMDEKFSRFYAACVASGLESMHLRSIVYRDLKPENLILAENGYVKIADFGLAKKTLRTFTVCGTPDYMAPETILSRGHDIAVDWWAVGVLLFELTLGKAPFPGRDPMDIYENILAHKNGDLKIPQGLKVSARFVDIMNSLMHHKKTRRLGCLKAGAESVRRHAFFSDFDWDKFYSFQMKPPIVRRRVQHQDPGNYDPEYDCEPDDQSDWKPMVDSVFEETPIYI